MLIFEESQPGRAASARMPGLVAVPAELPKELSRDMPSRRPGHPGRRALRLDGAGPAKARAA